MSTRAWMLASLTLTWALHAAAVVASVLGARPLAGRALPIALVCSAFALAAAVALRSRAPSSSSSSSPSPHALDAEPTPRAVESCLRLLWTGALLASAAGVAFAVLLPIVAYDALMYRVPVIAQWLDAGRIAWVVSDDPVRNGYPLGQEAVSALIAAAVGSLRFADVTSFAYVASGALALLELCSACGVRQAVARAAAALFLLAPMTILNTGTGYVDAAFAGAVIALLCNAALLAEPAPARDSALATGMAAANVLALKGTGLGFVVLVGAAIVLRLWLRRPAPALRTHANALLVAALLALPGTFFIARDLFHTGNPLWPVEIRLAGHTLLHGVAPMHEILDVLHNTPAELAALSPSLRIAHNWLQLHGPADVFDDRAAGLGWSWPCFALPALAALLLRVGRRLHVPESALFVVLTTCACFALQPMAWWARYTLWLWGAGALALALHAEAWLANARYHRLTLAAALLSLLTLTEAAVAIAYADGGVLALQRFWKLPSHDAAALADPRRAFNAEYWPEESFFALGLEREPDVCRGSVKAETDNAIVDGVFAQFEPRPRVHIIADDNADWPRVRAEWRAAGCSRLLLLRGSAVLPAVARDSSVALERVHGFDPLFVVRLSEVASRDVGERR